MTKIKAARKKSAKRSVKKTSLKKQSMRDVIVTPTIKQMEASIAKGKTMSASLFRTLTGW